MVKPIPNHFIAVDDEKVFMELIADSESDLSNLTEIEGSSIAFGSLCLVMETGDFWAFNSSNTWVNQTGG